MGADLANPFVLCADAHAASGFGHLARCSALANALLERRATVRCFALGRSKEITVDGIAFEAALSKFPIDSQLLFVDSYRSYPAIDAPVENAESVCRFHDHGPLPGDADLTVGLAEAPGPRVLAGTDYACVRRQYWVPPSPIPTPGPDGQPVILVSTGGGSGAWPVAKLAARVARVARGYRVIAIGTRPTADAPAAVQFSGPLPSLAPAIASASLVVSAAGQTMLETAATGRPCLAAALADNQRPQLEALVGQSAIASFTAEGSDLEGRLSGMLEDVEERHLLAARARRVIDGQGARRIAEALVEFAQRRQLPPELSVRPAESTDAEFLLELRNDPETLQQSRSSEVVGRAEHRAWLASALQDGDRHLLILEHDGNCVGQVRFDHSADRVYEISVAVAPEHRQKGLGSAAIGAGWRWLAARNAVRKILAYVKPQNAASRATFRRAGFGPSGISDEAGLMELELRLSTF